MATVEQEQLLTVEEAAAVLRLSRRRVYEKVASGDLEALRLGRGPRAPIRIPAHALDTFARSNSTHHLEAELDQLARELGAVA